MTIIEQIADMIDEQWKVILSDKDGNKVWYAAKDKYFSPSTEEAKELINGLTIRWKTNESQGVVPREWISRAFPPDIVKYIELKASLLTAKEWPTVDNINQLQMIMKLETK